MSLDSLIDEVIAKIHQNTLTELQPKYRDASTSPLYCKRNRDPTFTYLLSSEDETDEDEYIEEYKRIKPKKNCKPPISIADWSQSEEEYQTAKRLYSLMSSSVRTECNTIIDNLKQEGYLPVWDYCQDDDIWMCSPRFYMYKVDNVNCESDIRSLDDVAALWFGDVAVELYIWFLVIAKNCALSRDSNIIKTVDIADALNAFFRTNRYNCKLRNMTSINYTVTSSIADMIMGRFKETDISITNEAKKSLNTELHNLIYDILYKADEITEKQIDTNSDTTICTYRLYDAFCNKKRWDTCIVNRISMVADMIY